MRKSIVTQITQNDEHVSRMDIEAWGDAFMAELIEAQGLGLPRSITVELFRAMTARAIEKVVQEDKAWLSEISIAYEHQDVTNSVIRCLMSAARRLNSEIFFEVGFKDGFLESKKALALESSSPIPCLDVIHFLIMPESCLEVFRDVSVRQYLFKNSNQKELGRDIGYEAGSITSSLFALLETPFSIAGYDSFDNSYRALAGLAIQTYIFKYQYKIGATLQDELAMNISKFLNSSDEEDSYDPIAKCREIEKWAELAKLKNANAPDKFPLEAFSVYSLSSVLLNVTSGQKSAAVADPEPTWNRSSSRSYHFQLMETLREVIKAIREDALKGNERAQIVLISIFFQGLVQQSICQGKSSQEIRNLFFPWAKDEDSAYIRLRNWNCSSLIPEVTSEFNRILENARARNKFSSSVLQDYERERFSALDAPHKNMVVSLHNRVLGNASNGTTSVTDTAIIRVKLIDEAHKSASPIFDILNQSEKTSAALADCLTFFIDDTHRDTLELLPWIQEDLKSISDEFLEESPTLGLRYVPSNGLMALTLRGCSSSDVKERVKLLNEAHQRRDITATYFLSKEESTSVELRLERLEQVIESLERLLLKNARQEHFDRDPIDFGLDKHNAYVAPSYLENLYATMFRFASQDHRLLLRDKLIAKEQERREAIENLMAMFSHKFRGPVDSILFNTEHRHDESVYVDAARTMNGLLDVFGVVSTAPDRLASNLQNDTSGSGNPEGVLSHALHLALMQLLSARNRRRMSPHYLAYARRHEMVVESLRLSEWCRSDECEAMEAELQAKWESEVGSLGSKGSTNVLCAWMKNHIISVQVTGFSKSSVRFSDYGPTDSLLTVILTEILVNAIKHSEPGSLDSISITWTDDADKLHLSCTNPSTRDSRGRESSKGSGRGHKFLDLIAKHLCGVFIPEVLNDKSTVALEIPALLLNRETNT